MILFWKNVSEPQNPPDESAQHVSKKISLFRTNYFMIFLRKFRISPCFCIINMIRIRCFGPGELIQNGSGTEQWYSNLGPRRTHRACGTPRTPSSRRVVATAVDMNVSWAHSGDESRQTCCCKRFRKCSHLDVVHHSIFGSGIFFSRSQACNRSSMSSMKRPRPFKLSGMKDEVHRF